MLRNQWSRELLEKFNIPSSILESSSYKADKKSGIPNPFDWKKEDRVLICSYEFASRKSVDLKNVNWNLVVFDDQLIPMRKAGRKVQTKKSRIEDPANNHQRRI